MKTFRVFNSINLRESARRIRRAQGVLSDNQREVNFHLKNGTIDIETIRRLHERVGTVEATEAMANRFSILIDDILNRYSAGKMKSMDEVKEIVMEYLEIMPDLQKFFQ